jgi:hypothetical protein
MEPVKDSDGRHLVRRRRPAAARPGDMEEAGPFPCVGSSCVARLVQASNPTPDYGVLDLLAEPPFLLHHTQPLPPRGYAPLAGQWTGGGGPRAAPDHPPAQDDGPSPVRCSALPTMASSPVAIIKPSPAPDRGRWLGGVGIRTLYPSVDPGQC